MAYDEATLSLLTKEERAALEEDDENEIESNDEGVGEEARETPEENENGAGSQSDDNVSDESDAEVADGALEQVAPTPILVATAPDDLDAQLSALSTQKDALIEQFDSGELTAKEYQQQVDALAKQEREIERVKFKSELAEDLHRQQQANEWSAEVRRFTTENKVYGNEYAWNALDQAVRKIANSPDNANLSGRQILEKAHEELSGVFGWKQQEAETRTEAAAKPKIKHAAPPPTLAKMPAAEINDTDGNRYAALDRLMETDPLGYEAALGKMSKAERDAYLASA